MNPPGSGIGRRLRLIASATAAAIVMVVAVPAAIANYTGTYAPTQTVVPRQLLTPTLNACTTPGNTSVQLTWSDTDESTADPYASPAAMVVSSYVFERSPDQSVWTTVATATVGGVLFAIDSSPPSLAVNSKLYYRMHSKTSTNWISADSNTVTATVLLAVLGVVHVSCP